MREDRKIAKEKEQVGLGVLGHSKQKFPTSLLGPVPLVALLPIGKKRIHYFQRTR